MRSNVSKPTSVLHVLLSLTSKRSLNPRRHSVTIRICNPVSGDPCNPFPMTSKLFRHMRVEYSPSTIANRIDHLVQSGSTKSRYPQVACVYPNDVWSATTKT